MLQRIGGDRWRIVVRGTRRRPPHCIGFQQRQAALGISDRCRSQRASSIFEYQGDQYVVAYSAGNAFGRSVKGDSVWLFSLKGTLAEVDPPDATRVPTRRGGRIADVSVGQRVYSESCSACHGPRGQGGHEGPPLTSARDIERVMRTVREGGVQMPPLGSTLTPEEIQDVSAYVVERLVQ